MTRVRVVACVCSTGLKLLQTTCERAYPTRRVAGVIGLVTYPTDFFAYWCTMYRQ